MELKPMLFKWWNIKSTETISPSRLKIPKFMSKLILASYLNGRNWLSSTELISQCWSMQLAKPTLKYVPSTSYPLSLTRQTKAYLKRCTSKSKDSIQYTSWLLKWVTEERTIELPTIPLGLLCSLPVPFLIHEQDFKLFGALRGIMTKLCEFKTPPLMRLIRTLSLKGKVTYRSNPTNSQQL